MVSGWPWDLFYLVSRISPVWRTTKDDTLSAFVCLRRFVMEREGSGSPAAAAVAGPQRAAFAFTMAAPPRNEGDIPDCSPMGRTQRWRVERRWRAILR